VAWLSVAGLFVVGILIGVLGTHLYYARELGRPGGPPRLGARLFMERLERDLDLTAGQRASIEEILRQSWEESEALRQRLTPAVHAQLEATVERIREVLRPDQRRTFDELHERHRRRSEQLFLGHGMRGRSGPHRPPPPRP
jgi:hypothetical protein